MENVFRGLVLALGRLKFKTALTPEEVAACRRVAVGNDKCKNLAYLNPYYRPTLYLAGKQRLFGCFAASDASSAIRCSGMLVLYFWPYRQRGATSEFPEPSRFNLTLERARQDLQNETEFVAVLDKIRDLFQANGFFGKEKRDGRHEVTATQASKLWGQIEVLGRQVTRIETLELEICRLKEYLKRIPELQRIADALNEAALQDARKTAVASAPAATPDWLQNKVVSNPTA